MKKRLFVASVASILGTTLLAPLLVKAAAEYCHTTSGSYVCIQSVFGPRNNRGIVMTLDGRVSAHRINCYNYNYQRTSLFAVACWSYTAINAEPDNMPEVSEIPEEVKAMMIDGGFVPEDQAIDLEKVKNAMPDEMK